MHERLINTTERYTNKLQKLSAARSVGAEGETPEVKWGEEGGNPTQSIYRGTCCPTKHGL